MSRYYMELVALKLTKFCTNNLYHGTKYLYHGTYSNLNSFLIPQKQTFGTEILNFTKPAWNRFVQFDCCRFVKLNEFYRWIPVNFFEFYRYRYETGQNWTSVTPISAMTETFRMRIWPLLVKYIFPENVFSDLFWLVLFHFRFEIQPIAAPAAITSSTTMCAPRPWPARPHALRLCAWQPRGWHFSYILVQKPHIQMCIEGVRKRVGTPQDTLFSVPGKLGSRLY
jgi:hypothetical protein